MAKPTAVKPRSGGIMNPKNRDMDKNSPMKPPLTSLAMAQLMHDKVGAATEDAARRSATLKQNAAAMAQPTTPGQPTPASGLFQAMQDRVNGSNISSAMHTATQWYQKQK